MNRAQYRNNSEIYEHWQMSGSGECENIVPKLEYYQCFIHQYDHVCKYIKPLFVYKV